MLTGFQQFLAACIGQTEEETDQPDDAQRDDEPQTELEIATDDNSVDDTDPTVGPVPENAETEEDDAPSLPEEVPPADDASFCHYRRETTPMMTNEPNADNVSDESSDETSDAAPTDSDKSNPNHRRLLIRFPKTIQNPNQRVPHLNRKLRTVHKLQTIESENAETETQETDEIDKSDAAETEYLNLHN